MFEGFEEPSADVKSLFECPSSMYTLCPAAISDEFCAVPSVKDDHISVYFIDYSSDQFKHLNFIEYGKQRGTLFGLALNGSMLAACFEDGFLMIMDNVLDAQSSKPNYIKVAEDPLTCLRFKPSKQQIFLGSTTNRVYKFDFAEMRVRGSVEYATGKPGMTSISVCDDDQGKLILSSCWDNAVRLFQSKNLKLLGCLADRREKCGPVEFIRVNDKKVMFAAGLNDGSVVLWRPYD